MPRPRARQSKLPPEAASRKLVGNPKEGNQYGTDAQLDALRESLKVQMQSRKVPKAKVNSILTQIKQRSATRNWNEPSASSTPLQGRRATPTSARIRGTANASRVCPKCGMPVDTDGDETRLCEHCGWFGGNTETKRDPPRNGESNPVRAMLQTLALHRGCAQRTVHGVPAQAEDGLGRRPTPNQSAMPAKQQGMVNTFISLARVLANTQLETPAESGQVIDTPARGTPPAGDNNVPPSVAVRERNGPVAGQLDRPTLQRLQRALRHAGRSLRLRGLAL